MAKCKYYKPYMDILKQYCELLYTLDGCECGGVLHILLDDDNLEDDHIYYCLKECVLHSELPESNLGMLICNEYLKMTKEERIIFDWYWNGSKLENCCNDCEKCMYLINEDWY